MGCPAWKGCLALSHFWLHVELRSHVVEAGEAHWLVSSPPHPGTLRTYLALILSVWRCLALVGRPTLITSQAHKANQKAVDRTEEAKTTARTLADHCTPTLDTGPRFCPAAWRPLWLHWNNFLWALLLTITAPESDSGWAGPWPYA